MALEWLKTNAAAARKRVADEMTKFNNKKFMEAQISAIAMVAAADGDISSVEKQKMIAFFGSSDVLKVFKTSDVIAAFTAAADKFDFDAAIGRAEALKVIGRVRDDSESARMLVRVCCVIGAADGDFDAAEKATVVTICRELGLNPADFDL